MPPMKKKIIFIVILLTAIGLKAQSLSCSDFKNGTFIVPKVSEDLPDYKLIRNGNSQMEIIEMSGQTLNLYGILEWINECSYKLTYDGSKMKLPEELQFINDNGGIICEMIKIENKCFYYKSVLIIDGKEAHRIDGKYCVE